MARTAVVNRSRKRRRRRRNASPARASAPRRRRRRRNYGAAATVNPRRRRRRRNPASTYATRGYYRRPNPAPDMFDMRDATEILPAATAGVWAGRWAVRQAGPFEPAADGTLEPGLKHAIAVWLAASLGGQLVGQLFGSQAAGTYAKVAALGYGGDLFLRMRFARESGFVQNQLSLQGFYEDSPIGDGMGSTSFTDGAGNTYVLGPDGQWQLSGLGELVEYGGQLYSLEGQGTGARLAGFQSESALGLGRAYSNADSSFGYSY